MESSKKYFYIFIKHAAPVGLFIVLPLVASLFFGLNIINNEEKKHISEISARIENSLKDIESEIAPKSFMLKVGRGAWYKYKENKNNIDLFWNYYDSLIQFLHSEPDLYLFDEKGKLITHKKYNLKSRFLATKLWNSIIENYDERASKAVKLKKQLKSFLGNEFGIGGFLDSRNRLMPIITNTRSGYVYWMNMPDKPQEGLMLVFWETPSFDFRLEQIIKRYTDKFDDLFLRDIMGNFVPFVNKDKSSINNERYTNVYLKTVLMKNKDYYIDSKGILWKYVNIDNVFLLGSLQSNSNTFKKYSKNYITLIIVIGIIFISFYIWAVNQKDYTLSIRTKLLALFLIAVITPVMGFSYLAYQYLTDMHDNLCTEIGNESRDVLLNIDRELGSSGNVFRNEFREMAKKYQHYDEDPNIRKFFTDSLAKNDLVEIERRIASDATPISQLTNLLIFEDMNTITDSFAKCAIDATSNTNLMESVNPVLRTVIQSPESGMISFFQHPDNVQDFAFGPVEYYLYWNYLESSKYQKEYFIIIRLTETVLREHLQRRLLQCKTNPKEKEFKIFVCNNRKDIWFPDSSLKSELKAFSRRVDYMGKPIETEIDINSRHYLLLGLKSSKLRGYSFYALYPYEKIQERLNKAKVVIISSIILFIIMALSIGNLLSSTFLFPVKRLEDGVKAIKERNTVFRIESLQNDEFGGLAISFNKMISDLKEMELAKYIQESLLPQSLPKLNGYEMCFSNKMASGVGGDYFDTLLLDEDNLCVIIGDVSGHGVASALVMAIAKAVLYHGFKETRDLIDLFGDLNSVVNTYFSKPPVKKMITLFGTIINLSTGKAVFIDCGHNFPMKISTDGNITELKMTGLPVGILKKIRKPKTDNFIIDKGETIVFYTDGIVEATGKTEEQYGYDRFKKNLSEMANEDSDTIKNTLLDKYTKWEDGTEPDDDVTLVILKRLSSQNNESDIIS